MHGKKENEQKVIGRKANGQKVNGQRTRKFGGWGRVFCLAGAAVLLTGAILTGCGKKSGKKGTEQTETYRTVFEVCGKEAEEFAENFRAEQVEEIRYQREYETADTYILADNAEKTEALFRALAEIKVLETTEEEAADAGDEVAFVMKSGETYCFAFNMHNLKAGEKCYKIDGAKTLWKFLKDWTEAY